MSYMTNMSNVSDMTNMSNVSDMSNVNNMSDRRYRSNMSDRRYRSYRIFTSMNMIVSNAILGLSFLDHQ